MEILPGTVFKFLSRELLKERKCHSAYNSFLYKAGLFRIGGTLTTHEILTESIKQVSAATIQFAGFTIVRAINAKQPIKHLDGLYDLLAAVGKALYLNIRIRNNGHLLQEIRYEAETGLEKALKELVVELREKATIEKCSLVPLHVSGLAVKKEPAPSTLTGGMREDAAFAEALRPKAPVKDGKKRTAPSPVPPLKKEPSDIRLFEQKSLTSSSCSSDFSDSCDDEPPVLKKEEKVSELKIEQEDIGVDYEVVKPTQDCELLEQRQLLKDIVEKYVQWAKKIDVHLLKHVTGCKLCPEHCYAVLSKKIKRECGRKISSTKKK